MHGLSPTLAIAALAMASLLAGCPEDNPDYCSSDQQCKDRDPLKPECHGEGNFCYEGCQRHANCTDATKSWYREGHPYCDPATRDCVATRPPDAGPDDGPDQPDLGDGDLGGDILVPDFGPNKLEDGEACTVDGQCKNGHCVDDVCCDGACGGTCEACNLTAAKGACTKIPASAGPQAECPGDADCGDGVCDGSGGCSYPKVGQACGTSTCSGDNVINSTCDSAHKCVTQAPQSCSPYACDTGTGACHTSCTQHGHCLSGSACDRTAAHMSGFGTCVDPAQADTVGSGQEIATVVNSTSKPVVLVPAGTYNTAIVLKSKTVKIISTATTGTSKLDPTPDGPAITVEDGASLTLQGLTVQGATAASGDGIYCQGTSTTKSTLVVMESTIADNKAHGVQASFCDVTLRRNVIQSNQAGGAKLSDGAFVVVNNVVVDNGTVSSAVIGGLSLSPTASTGNTLYNNTIANNGGSHIPTGGAVKCLTSVAIANSILYSNGSSPNLGCSFTYSDVEGGATGTGNINTNPTFTATFVPQEAACFNSGTATTGVTIIDITGGPRLKGSAVDMGAYEVQ